MGRQEFTGTTMRFARGTPVGKLSGTIYECTHGDIEKYAVDCTCDGCLNKHQDGVDYSHRMFLYEWDKAASLATETVDFYRWHVLAPLLIILLLGICFVVLLQRRVAKTLCRPGPLNNSKPKASWCSVLS